MKESFEPKKASVLRVLQILARYSDEKHRLTLKEIGEKLYSEYGITLERKAVKRTILLLQELLDNFTPLDKSHLSVSIEYDERHGAYMSERLFEESELRLLIDSVLASKHIGVKYTKDLIEKLCLFSNKYFRSHIKHVNMVNDWNKSENKDLFSNISYIDEAIEKGCKIKFDYYKYGTDGKLYKSSTHIASPYQMILHNQRYYLMFLSETWGNVSYWRIDKMKEMTILENDPIVPLTSIKGNERGIDYKKFSSSLPYLYSDEIKPVEFIADKGIIDQVVDWFGSGAKMFKLPDDKVRVKLNASIDAMEYWAMQYIKHVEIVRPEELRNRIKANIEDAKTKYDK